MRDPQHLRAILSMEGFGWMGSQIVGGLRNFLKRIDISNSIVTIQSTESTLIQIMDAGTSLQWGMDQTGRS